jgi:hypothetical protein
MESESRAATSKVLEVCIPTRKRTDFFKEALASVESAAVDSLSLLIFQNSPGSIWREEDLQAFSGPKRLECSGEDLPIAASWNAVLERCEADWIHILHDDDWVDPQFYRTFLRDLADQPPFGLWLCGTADSWGYAEVVNIVEVPDLWTCDPEVIAEQFLVKAKTRCVSVILNRAIARRVGGFDHRMRHSLDVDLFLRVALTGGARFCSATLGHYRLHAASSTGIGKEATNAPRKTIPILEDRRSLEDHLVFLSNQSARNLRLGPVRRYSAGVLWGGLRYYMRRGKLASLPMCLRGLAYHYYLFLVKAHLR